MYGALNHPTVQANAHNFVVFQNPDYAHYNNPPVTSVNIDTTFSNVASNIVGVRIIQLGLKLYL